MVTRQSPYSGVAAKDYAEHQPQHSQGSLPFLSLCRPFQSGQGQQDGRNGRCEEHRQDYEQVSHRDKYIGVLHVGN